jgi:hypothetical protein
MAEDPQGIKMLVRIISEGIEEGTDQYAMHRIREQKKKEREAKMRPQGLLAKQAGGANFPPISGPTVTSGITTSSQREEKIRRAPPLPAKEDQPLGAFDIDKIASFLDSVVKKGRLESTADKADHIKQVYEDAVYADRKHRILESLASGALSSGLGLGIPTALAAGPTTGLQVGALAGLLGGGIGTVMGSLSSLRTRSRISALMHEQGLEGLKDFIAKRNPATSGLLSGALAGGAGAGVRMSLQGVNMNPFDDRMQGTLGDAGRLIGQYAPAAVSMGAGLGATELSRRVSDSIHEKTSSPYDQYPHYEEDRELPADRYSNSRQGMLYGISALHPIAASLAAAATAHPDERFDQLGRTMVGGLAGDVVGGVAGAAFGGPAGFGVGSLVGRPIGTYIAHHVE